MHACMHAYIQTCTCTQASSNSRAQQTTNTTGMHASGKLQTLIARYTQPGFSLVETRPFLGLDTEGARIKEELLRIMRLLLFAVKFKV